MKIIKWLSFFFITGLLASCYPEKDRSIEDFDIVGTKFEETADFQSYKTYHLYDSIIVIYDTTEEKPEYPAEAAAIVLDNIKSNLLAYGWIEANATDTPDVYIESATWNSTVQGVTYYPGWGYPGWGYPGYPGYPGWGYPGYGTSYYSYTTGTITISMMDVKNYDFDDSAPMVIWNAGINGVLTSSNSSTLSRVDFSVNQAFIQSAYLNIK